MRPDGVDDEKYYGAFVLEPERGVHEDVANFDFSSLYPSVFTSFNVSPDTYLPPAEAARLQAAAPATVTTCPTVEVEPGVFVGGSRFVRGPLGVIPSVYATVAKKRAEWKKEAARHVPNSPAYLAARRMEYAYKTLGLSMYGVMGSVFSRYYNRHVAEAVTLTAQFLIRLTMESARRSGFRPLYGDTDSVFIALPQDRVPSFLAHAAKLYEAATRAFGCATNLIELEYEQFFGRIVLIGKKRYFGRLVVQKGRPCDVLEVKGLEMRRSDGSAALRQLQTQLVEGLARGGWSAKRTVQWALAVKDFLFAGGFGADDLKITAGVQKPLDEYVSKTPPPQVVIARRMRERGQEVYVGTKIAYVVLNGLRGVKESESVQEWSGAYDPVYYWCNKIWPALARVLKVALPNEDWKVFDEVWYPKLKNKLQPVSVRSNGGDLAQWISQQNAVVESSGLKGTG
jgi:DNA polymerase elongation subunit (family B)